MTGVACQASVVEGSSKEDASKSVAVRLAQLRQHIRRVVHDVSKTISATKAQNVDAGMVCFWEIVYVEPRKRHTTMTGGHAAACYADGVIQTL